MAQDERPTRQASPNGEALSRRPQLALAQFVSTFWFRLCSQGESDKRSSCLPHPSEDAETY